jgi:superfamily II DNA or RNA helicase
MKIYKRGKYYIKKSDLSNYNTRYLLSAFTYYNHKNDTYKQSVDFGKEYVSFPRNILKLKKLFDKYEIIDQTVFPTISKKVILKSSFSLKNSQEKAMSEIFKELKNREDGSVILKAPPGFGKSYTLPYIVSKVQTNTLIIVDRSNLADQMYKEFTHNCEDVDIVILGGTSREPSSITIVTFQFLIRNKKFMEDYKDYFGLIVVDECHVIGSDVFTKLVGVFNAKYRLGLSATPTRSDFMTGLLLDVMGTKLVSGESEDNLNVTLIATKHDAHFIYMGGMGQYKKAFGEFLIRPKVSDSVFEVMNNLKKLGRFGLLYITEVDAQENYAERLRKMGFRVGVINQKTPKQERSDYLLMMEEEKIDVIISGTILQKGISIKRLDYVINLSNLTVEAHEQLIGRLRRHHPTKKKPLFIDFLFNGKLFYKSLDRIGFAQKVAKQHNDSYVSISYDKLLKKLKQA